MNEDKNVARKVNHTPLAPDAKCDQATVSRCGALKNGFRTDMVSPIDTCVETFGGATLRGRGQR